MFALFQNAKSYSCRGHVLFVNGIFVRSGNGNRAWIGNRLRLFWWRGTAASWHRFDTVFDRIVVGLFHALVLQDTGREKSKGQGVNYSQLKGVRN